ncbi:ankyrin repeat domain-containing protein [Clostridium perfringens]
MVEMKKNIRKYIRNGEIENLKKIFDDNPELLSIKSVLGSWLHLACDSENLSLVKYFINKGLDINYKSGIPFAAPINIAATNGNIEIVKYLIECGANLDTSDSVSNPLFGAIYGGNKEVVEILINNGIDLSKKYFGDSISGMDAYNFAIERGEVDIAELIKEKMLEKGLPVRNIFKDK